MKKEKADVFTTTGGAIYPRHIDLAAMNAQTQGKQFLVGKRKTKVPENNSAVEFYCKGVGCELLRFPTRGPLFYRFDSKGSRFSNFTFIT